MWSKKIDSAKKKIQKCIKTSMHFLVRRLQIEVQFPGYFLKNRLQKKYCKIEVNTPKKFWSHKSFTNIKKSLFEPQYESKNCDLKILLTHGLTINIKTKIPIFVLNEYFWSKISETFS